MQQFSIGAVSRLTGIPAHTLRKWESRHGIAIPIRTETGRRAYTQDHVDQLRLVKTLVGRRHALSQLAGLPLPELQALASLHEDPPAQQAETTQVALIGPTLNHLLLANPHVVSRSPRRVEDAEIPPPEKCDTLIIESDTLPTRLAERLIAWANEGRTVIAVYRFTSRPVLKRLEDAGVLLAQAPITDQTLARLLTFAPPSSDTAPSLAKFSPEELARVAALTPSVSCECPNHIAKLLMEISSFERYSEQCIDQDPTEQALHGQLRDISAQARVLFEDALVAVATADGLRLNTNPTDH